MPTARPLVADGFISLYVEGDKRGEFSRYSLHVVDHSVTPAHQGGVETIGRLDGFQAIPGTPMAPPVDEAVGLFYTTGGVAFTIEGRLLSDGSFRGGEPVRAS